MHRVHPRLRPFVAAALGYRPEGMAPGEHLGLPSPFLTFVVPFDEPLEMAAHPDPAQAPGRYDGLVGGLHTRPARIAHPGRQAGIQLSLTPARDRHSRVRCAWSAKPVAPASPARSSGRPSAARTASSRRARSNRTTRAASLGASDLRAGRVVVRLPEQYLLQDGEARRPAHR